MWHDQIFEGVERFGSPTEVKYDLCKLINTVRIVRSRPDGGHSPGSHHQLILSWSSSWVTSRQLVWRPSAQWCGGGVTPQWTASPPPGTGVTQFTWGQVLGTWEGCQCYTAPEPPHSQASPPPPPECPASCLATTPSCSGTDTGGLLTPPSSQTSWDELNLGGRSLVHLLTCWTRA